jgi:deoxyribose-phosphate aldolase
MKLTPTELAARIEHTILKPEATPEQIDRLCDEAVAFGFRAVCVNPVYVRRAAERLRSVRTESGGLKGPIVVSVAGFPLGASLTATKSDEARRALDDGASEIDMVVILGALMAGDRTAVRKDIEALARVVHPSGPQYKLKVILETAALTEEQFILGCRCAMEGEADFVKTSTGFHPKGGATVEHVRLLHRYASPMKVKASGGIRTAEAALALLDAGASTIGTSSGPAIMRESQAQPRFT